MTIAANQEAFRDPRWTSGPQRGPQWGGPNWGGPQWGGGHHFGHMPFPPKPLLIVATILGFIFWWPVGLGLLIFSIATGRMFCRGYRRHGGDGHHSDRSWNAWKSWRDGASPSSGNSAFDEYRAETLRRLEDEQKEFTGFLDRLRFAKDKAEFDQFMAERRQRPTEPPAEPSQA